MALEHVNEGIPASLATELEIEDNCLAVMQASGELVARVDGPMIGLDLRREVAQLLVILLHVAASQVEAVVAASDVDNLQKFSDLGV